MIDHVSIVVTDLQRSRKLYAAMLAPLGMREMYVDDERAAFGKRHPELWLNHRPNAKLPQGERGDHLCLRAPDEAAVREFHRIALAHGCTDSGAPGMIRAVLGEYFGAFVLDPDSNQIEAATFTPSTGTREATLERSA